jgi:hypothetical protein
MDWIPGITQALWFCMKTLGNVVDSHSAKWFKSDFPGVSWKRFVQEVSF